MSIDDDDDDPFSAPEDDPFTAAAKEEAANKANAVAVSPRKGKVNTLEIKCPMCESVGYIPETAAGKDVKCYNPKCSMPNFLAPKRFAAPAPVTPVKPVKAKSNSKLPLILSLVGGVALVGVVGAVAFFWDNSPPDPGKPVFPVLSADPTLAATTPNNPAANPANSTGTTGEKSPTTETAPPVAKGPDVVDMLRFMDLLSSEDNNRQNKIKCRRLVSLGHAFRNDSSGMENQFQIIDGIDKQQGSFKVPALLTLAWNQFEAGDKSGALKSVELARGQEGNSSRETQEPAMEMASLLMALGQLPEAQSALSNRLQADQNTPLAVILATARHRRDYDLTQELPGATSALDRPWPRLGVTLILAAHGLWKESHDWANAINDDEAKTDCLIAWADARTRAALASKAQVDPAVEGLAANLSPSAKVILFGRLALTHAVAENTAEAERLIKAGQDALKGISVPTAARTEGFKEALDWKPPQSLPLQQAILGAGLIGQAQARLKQVDAGWLTTLEALKIARAMAPSPDAVVELKRSVDDLGGAGLNAKLRMLLALRTENDAVKKASDLKASIRRMTADAVARYQLQESVLISATHAGLASLVLKEVLSLAHRSDVNTREQFLYGMLATHLRHELESAGKQDEVAELKSKLEGAEIPHDEVFELSHLADVSLSKAKFGDVINFANEHKLSPGAEAVVIKSFIKAAKTPELGVETLKSIEKLDLKTNPSLNLVKLEGLRMTSAYLARGGKGAEAKDLLYLQYTTPLEKISGYLGVIEGDTVRQRLAAAAPPAAPAK